MKPRDTIANLVNSLDDINLSDDNKTDDDMLETSVFMVKQRIAMDPPSDIIDVKAHFEYCDMDTGNNKLYAITDGGADSCILKKMHMSLLLLEDMLTWLVIILRLPELKKFPLSLH